MEPVTAAMVLESLRTGTVPLDYVEHFNVGRQVELAQAIDGINAAEGGRARIAFVNGPYGSGKTHFLGLIRSEGFRRNFAVTHVVLSSASCPLDRLEMVFGALMGNLRTPECRDTSAFRSVLDEYIKMVECDLIKTGVANKPCRHPAVGSYLTCGHGCFAELLIKRLAKEGTLTTDFLIVLSSYFNASRSNDQERMRLCERWLLGQTLSARKRTNICRLAPPHTRLDNISNESALKAFSDAARFLRTVGYRGLIIMLDEAEIMPSAGRAGRDSSFFNLFSLIRSCQDWQNIFCVYATTPYFDHVFRTYIGQYRIPSSFEDKYQEHQIRLSTPDGGTLTKLASKIYGIYETAYGSQCLPGRSWLESESKELLGGISESDSTRDFVTRIIGRMDSARR